MATIQTIGIVGAGQIGGGIAQVCASHGLDVLLHDIDPAQVEKARAGIEQGLGKLVAKGTMPAAVLRFSSSFSSSGRT